MSRDWGIHLPTMPPQFTQPLTSKSKFQQHLQHDHAVPARSRTNLQMRRDWLQGDTTQSTDSSWPTALPFTESNIDPNPPECRNGYKKYINQKNRKEFNSIMAAIIHAAVASSHPFSFQPGNHSGASHHQSSGGCFLIWTCSSVGPMQRKKLPKKASTKF